MWKCFLYVLKWNVLLSIEQWRIDELKLSSKCNTCKCVRYKFDRFSLRFFFYLLRPTRTCHKYICKICASAALSVKGNQCERSSTRFARRRRTTNKFIPIYKMEKVCAAFAMLIYLIPNDIVQSMVRLSCRKT